MLRCPAAFEPVDGCSLLVESILPHLFAFFSFDFCVVPVYFRLRFPTVIPHVVNPRGLLECAFFFHEMLVKALRNKSTRQRFGIHLQQATLTLQALISVCKTRFVSVGRKFSHEQTSNRLGRKALPLCANKHI